MWLRKNGVNDPNYHSIDLTRVMCSACDNGNESLCDRANEAVALIMASRKRRPRANRKRHSYDKSHVFSIGTRLGAEKKQKVTGALKDSTNLPRDFIQTKRPVCRMPTPSKISARRKREIVSSMAEGLND